MQPNYVNSLPTEIIHTTSQMNNTTFPSKLIQEFERKEKMEKLQNHNKKLIKLKQEVKNAKTNKEISSIKNQIYDDLNSISSQMNQVKDNYSRLMEENQYLQEQIKQNEEKLNQYEQIVNDLKNKFHAIEDESDQLQQKLIETKEKTKKTIENNNNIFLSSLNEIKDQINQIEVDYKNQIKDKSNQIKQLNKQIEEASNENFQMNKTATEFSEHSKKENDDLKCRINCLLKEKEILIHEKQMDEVQIQDYQNQIDNQIFKKNKQRISKQNQQYLDNIKDKYQNEVALLQKSIAEKELQIEKNKSHFLDIVSQLKNEYSFLQEQLNAILIDNDCDEEPLTYTIDSQNKNNNKCNCTCNYCHCGEQFN